MTTQKLEAAAGLALEVLEKYRQHHGDAPMGLLGHNAIEALREAFREQRESEDLERCPFCGALVEFPCDEPPPDTCEKALAAIYWKDKP